MKTIRKTVVLFVVFLLGSYLFPLFFHFEQSEPIVVPEENSASDAETSSVLETSNMEQTFVAATGFSNYVGMAVDDFMVDYGDPVEIKGLSNGGELWVYGTHSTDYLMLKVSNYVITDILVLGSEMDISPFEMGMGPAEMYQVASFNPKVEVYYENQSVNINLNENELNTQPLVAFDNQTYAVLTLDSKTNTVIGIHYMNNESLIESGLYKVSAFSSLTEENTVQNNQAIQEKIKAEQTFQYINALREKQGLEKLDYSLVLSAVGNNLYDYHENSQEQEENTIENGTQPDSSDDALIINEEASIEIVEETETSKAELESEQSQEESTKINKLDEDTIQAYLNEKDIQLENVRLLYQPVQTKPSIYVLQWFTLAEYRDILMNESMKRIGISFRGDELLLILDNGDEIEL